jgi:hypothetical protein
MLNLNESSGKKSFWEGPDRIPGAIGLFVILGALAYGFILALPTLLIWATNTILLFVEIGVICGILGAFANDKFRATMWTKYKSLINKASGLIITNDPIGMAKASIGILQENRVSMDKQLGILNGHLKITEQEVSTNNATIDSKMREASAAQKNLNVETDETRKMKIKGAMVLATREASRLKESNDRLIPMKHQIKMLYDMINKYYIASDFLIKDISAELAVKEREWKTLVAGSKAVSAAKTIFGNSTQMEIFNESMVALNEDIGARVGVITRFMDNSESVLTSIDIQNGMLEEEGLKMLEQYNAQTFDIIFDTSNLGKKEEPIKILANPGQQVSTKFGNLLD